MDLQGFNRESSPVATGSFRGLENVTSRIFVLYSETQLFDAKMYRTDSGAAQGRHGCPRFLVAKILLSSMRYAAVGERASETVDDHYAL